MREASVRVKVGTHSLGMYKVNLSDLRKWTMAEEEARRAAGAPFFVLSESGWAARMVVEGDQIEVRKDTSGSVYQRIVVDRIGDGWLGGYLL